MSPIANPVNRTSSSGRRWGSWDCDMKSDMNDSSDLEIPIPSVRWYWCVLRHRNFTGRIPARPSSTVGGSSRLR